MRRVRVARGRGSHRQLAAGRCRRGGISRGRAQAGGMHGRNNRRASRARRRSGRGSRGSRRSRSRRSRTRSGRRSRSRSRSRRARSGDRSRATSRNIHGHRLLPTTAAVLLKDNHMGLLPLRNSNHTERGASRAIPTTPHHLINAVNVRVDLARKPITAVPLADNLDTEIRHLVPERRRRLKIDRVPADLDKRVPATNCVCASHVRGPISVRIRRGAPYAGGFGVNPGGVDVVTKFLVSMYGTW